MTTLIQSEPMTTEQLLAMPDDGQERWLIAGQLREKQMARRNRGHSRVEFKIGYLLRKWLEDRQDLRGEVLGGEAGIILQRNPDTTVGVDVAYVSGETADANPDEQGMLEGVPLLMVEVLSPSDKHEEIAEKVASYLECGVKLVWVVDVVFRTVTVYRADAEPQLFNVTQQLSGEPYLPGFNVSVAEVFSR